MATFNSIDRVAAINPKSAFPLDARSYFENKTLEEVTNIIKNAKEAGSTDSVYYIGQIITIVNNGVSNAYQITPDVISSAGVVQSCKLKNLGGVENGDGKVKLVYDDTLAALKFVFT